MKYFQSSVDGVLEALNTNKKTGLTEQQIKENRVKYGINEFSSPPKPSFFKKIIDTLKDPMIFILIISAFITISMNVVKHFKGGNAEFTESIGILIAIIISSGITILMEGKSEKAFETLNNINDDIKVKVIRNGKIQYILKKDIVMGDIIKIETGDKIPADGRLVDSLQLKIDESMLTGESVAVNKDSSLILKDEKTMLADRKNMVYSGTFVTYGQGTMIVTGIGDHTEMGAIANELKNAVSSDTPLQEKLKVLGKTISIVGSAIAGVIFLISIGKMFLSNSISFDGVQDAFITSIALIVAAVPEGLATTVAITLSLNIIKMAKNNALVRKLVACETIGCTNVICSDKTGTLTENKMSVIEIWNNGVLASPDKLKSGYMMENFCLNSTANIQKEKGTTKFIGNPTECSLLEAFQKTECANNHKACAGNCNCNNKCDRYLNNELDILDYKSIRNAVKPEYQYPFSSDKKCMSSVIKDDENFIMYSKGSPEVILSFCSKVIIKDKVVELNDIIRKSIEKEIEALQGEAKRIIGFSHKEFSDSMNWETSEASLQRNMVFDGFVSIADPLRQDVFDAVDRCKNAGITLKILTGDNIVTAKTIAKQLNIVKKDSLILEAKDIDEMSDKELISKIDKIVVIARSKPLTKMRIVNILKKLGNVVAVTGDGINDAPALKNADLGIAMGITGTEVSKEASDIVLLDDSFSTIVNAVEWGRGIYENFQRFIQFQLTVNVVAVITVFLSEIFGFDLPFTTTQLLWVNLIMDGPPALSLGLEALRDNLMDKRPIKRNSSIITKEMFKKIILNGSFIILMLMLLMFKNVLNTSPKEQSTIIFTSFVFFQLFNAFNSRELNSDSIFKNFFKNKPMILIVSVTFMLQIFIVEFGGSIFKTVPLDFTTICKTIAYSSSVIVFSEAVKIVERMFSSDKYSVKDENTLSKAA